MEVNMTPEIAASLAKLFVVIFAGSLGFAKGYIPFILRIIFIGIAVAMVAWMLSPYIS